MRRNLGIDGRQDPCPVSLSERGSFRRQAIVKNLRLDSYIREVLELADFDAAVADFVVVVLQEDVSFLRETKVVDLRVFAAGDEGSVDVVAAIVFDDFESVEPVLNRSIG